MKAAFGLTLNRTDMAACCGIDVKTLDAWVREGCPVSRPGSRGVPAEFNSADVWKWHEARLRAKLVAPVQQRRDELELRKLEAQTIAAELDLAKTRAEVAPVAEFEKMMGCRMAVIRTNVMQVAQRAAVQLLGETNETTFKTKLREELTLALITAAESEVDLADDPDEVDPV
ncbi:hypothetical protein [Caballeronia glebae]|uniref:hypothetical protein n=1 Tax=Caballeronia glebae TaxID=1777143 RepID=UPI0038BBCA09